MNWRCLHLGAKPLSRCYCGELVSAMDAERAYRMREDVRIRFGAGWRIERDANGFPVCMVWS